MLYFYGQGCNFVRMKIIRQTFILFMALLFLVSTGGVSYLHHICWNHKAEKFYFVAKHACCTSDSSCCNAEDLCCSNNQVCTHSSGEDGLQTVSPIACCTDTYHFIRNGHPFRLNDNQIYQLFACLVFQYTQCKLIAPLKLKSMPFEYMFCSRNGPDLLLHICVLRT